VLAVSGHAGDAAIAANAVMGVVAPMMNGIGGDLFAIVHDISTGTIHGLNASGWSPAGATIEFRTSRGLTTMPQTGIHSVTVPGAVSGWMALHEKFGHDSFDTILSAAIAGSRPGHLEHRRPRFEYSAGARGAALRQADVSGNRRDDGVTVS